MRFNFRLMGRIFSKRYFIRCSFEGQVVPDFTVLCLFLIAIFQNYGITHLMI